MSGKMFFRNRTKTIVTALILLLTLSMLGIFTIPAKAQSLSVVSPSPAKGYVFTEVTLEGTGWPLRATVEIYFNSTAKGIFLHITDVTTNATGGFKITVTVPAVPPGLYTWYAVAPGTTYKAKADFEVLEGIGVTPTSGPVGSTAFVAGSSAPWSNKLVCIIFDKNGNSKLDAGEILANVTADKNGVISTKVVIPDVKAGTYNFYANKTTVNIGDSFTSVNSFSTSFEVLKPILKINPQSGPVLSKVSIAGNYFKVNSKVANITLEMNKKPVSILAKDVPTNATGGFNITVAIPFCTKAGTYVVNATDGINYRDPMTTVQFTVSSPLIVEPLQSAKVGESLTIEGKDFAVSSPVTIYFSINRDGTYELIHAGKFMTNATGGFKVSVKVPPVPHEYGVTDIVKVNVTDNCNYATADFDVEAAITLSPIRGPVGFNVTVIGTGFRNQTTVTITFDTTTMKENVPTDKYGSFITFFIVPEVPDGLYDVKATDAKGNYATTKFQVVAVELKTILEAVQEVEKKLDTILTQGISVNLTSVLNAIAGIDKKLGQFLGSDTVASLLYEIKTSVTAINAKLGVFSGSDTVASLLYDIKGKLSTITAGAQATSGSNIAEFTASGSQVIYAGSKVGTVTVSIKTSGVSGGERLIIRYYIDSVNYIEKVVTSNRDIAGWTDTAAALKVEIVYTWRSGTDKVYWSYSAIYPP